MARKNNTATVETEAKELSPEAIAAREAVANRPRQSEVRFVEYFKIIEEAAPERLDEFFGDQVYDLREVADKVGNPIQDAIEKAVAGRLELAIKALENTDPLNGYAGHVFDKEKFEEKTRPKTVRTKKTVVDKVESDIANASDEELAAIAELMKARGISL